MDRRGAMVRTPKKKSAVKKKAAKRRTRQKRADSASQAPAASTGRAASAAPYRAKIRMYRQGLGDCFLVTLPRNDRSGRPFYLMIDCGVVLGTGDPATIMTKVMEDIFKVTGGNIDVLVATHEHWDHLSGFVQAEPSFAKLQIGQGGLARGGKPDDDLTKTLKAEKGQALAALRMGLSHLQLSGDTQGADELGGVLE